MAKDVRRWHGTDCVQPDVCVGNDLVPFCQACGISAFAVLQTLTTGESSSVPQIPVDEAPGQYNLFWPPSVPYTDIEVHGTTDEKEQFPEKTRGPVESDKGETMGGLGDSVYTKSLSSRQIRLIVLAASPRGQKNFPIHFSLEIHDDLRCPEYDAVSYTWGGEENDYTRTSPVFVGEYWDTLALSKNFVSMLNYLRPSRGLRTLWVDAVCINQNDLKERTVQAGKMQDIYARCSQVWLWLGDDIVCTDMQSPPARYWLQEIGSKSFQPRYHTKFNDEMPPVTISMLLERRYFGRVWVIQELALAPRIVIPVGDVLLHADHVTQQKLQSLTVTGGGWQWHETRAPWLNYMAVGPLEERKLHDVLRFTSRSNATDIRDKIFGVLGLVTPMPSNKYGKPSLQPDYSISKLHMTIGLLAHLIIIRGRVNLFYASRGIHSARGLSWLPYLDEQVDWERTFNDQPEDKMNLHLAYNAIRSRYGLTACSSESSTMLCRFRAWYIYSPLDVETPPKARWKYKCSINSRNGVFSLNLIKMLTIASAPRHILDYEGWGVYRFEQRTSLFVNIASRHPLNDIILENDEIFILRGKSAPRPLLWEPDDETHVLAFLILRKLHEESYRLVACTPYVSFVTTAPTGPSMLHRPRINLLFHPYISYTEPTAMPLTSQEIGFPKSVADHMTDLKQWLDLRFYWDDEAEGGGDNLFHAIPGHQSSTRWIYLPVLVRVESFEILLDNEECRRYEAGFSDGYLHLTTDKVYLNKQYGSDRGSRLCQIWEFYYEESSLWTPLYLTKGGLSEGTFPHGDQISLRCPRETLESTIKYHQRITLIKELWETGLLGSDFPTFEARLRAGPLSEDFSCIAPFPREDLHFIDQLDFGTRMTRVSIH